MHGRALEEDVALPAAAAQRVGAGLLLRVLAEDGDDDAWGFGRGARR